METPTESPEDKSLWKTIRQSVLPVKETDHQLVRIGKDAGFAVFLILFSCVSLALVSAIAFVL